MFSRKIILQKELRFGSDTDNNDRNNLDIKLEVLVDRD